MIYLPQGLPAAAALSTPVYPLSLWAATEGCLRVLFLNLMPQKEVTEMDIARTLAATGTDAQLIPIRISGQKYKTTPQEYVERFYLPFEEVEPYSFDRLIITGAPVEQMPFEQVRYWPQLCHIMEWADRHVKRTLYICWGAQAGLYFHYGIPKYSLPAKRFGIYSQRVTGFRSPLTEGLKPTFPMPHSRHTEVRVADLQDHQDEGLDLLAVSPESGVGLAATANCRRTFIAGHLEYEPYTLDREYQRDLKRQLPIQPPEHYYAPDGTVPHVWQTAAVTFYRNWLSHNG